ncbi:MAG TPA: DUF1588 domain-containing protein [Polyangiaceae bacterium]|nr:DUF1588 domain-containing protein [Polyangiaceae bacterium]
MNYFRHVGPSIAIAGLIGCSGTYQVGGDAARAGTSNANTNTNAGTTDVGGAPSSVVSSGGSDAANSQGGIFPSNDPGSDPDAPAFCGRQLPTAHSIELAPPAVVYQRVLKFLYDTDPVIPDDLPSETTREWAGSFAVGALAVVSTPTVAGMDRFVKNWWGTPTPEFSSMYFNARGNTLTDLLTGQIQVPKGAGLLTDPAVLSQPFITARGNFINNRLLCAQLLPSDPSTVTQLRPGQTRRSEVEQLTAPATCAGCHKLVDPFGFALENFTTDGTFRTIENDLTIDTNAVLSLPQTGQVSVRDAPSMGLALAKSCEVALCLTQQLLHDAAVSAQLPNEASTAEAVQIAARFTAAGLSLTELVRLVVESDAFLAPN